MILLFTKMYQLLRSNWEWAIRPMMGQVCRYMYIQVYAGAGAGQGGLMFPLHLFGRQFILQAEYHLVLPWSFRHPYSVICQDTENSTSYPVLPTS